jgi:flagellum-specific ATP synthase
VLESISRVMIDVVSEERRTLAGDLRHVLATYRQAEDLINIGAYVPESNPEIDRAIRLMPAITAFLRQGLYEQGDFEAIPAQLRDLLGG